MTPDDFKLTTAEFAALTKTPFLEFFGEGFETESLTALILGGERRARRIIRSLKPFAKAGTFPESYNLRSTHALFALAFLYYSPHFRDFCKQAKRLNGPFLERKEDRKALVYMMENIKNYNYLSQFQGKAVRFYNEMNSLFIDQHVQYNFPAIVEDQAVLVVDFMNPVEKIKAEIESIIICLQNKLDYLVTNTIDSPVSKKHLPSRHGLPLVNDQGQTVRTPETYLPEWYEALQVYRMKKRRWNETKIIKWLWPKVAKKASATFADPLPGRKTTIHNRQKLALRLIDAAYNRIPLTGHHTRS